MGRGKVGLRVVLLWVQVKETDGTGRKKGISRDVWMVVGEMSRVGEGMPMKEIDQSGRKRYQQGMLR